MKSILFTKEMVLAILKGRKTQTRRLIKNLDSLFINKETDIKGDNLFTIRALFNKGKVRSVNGGGGYLPVEVLNPKYKIGDLVYVKEPAYISSKHFDDDLSNFPDGVVVGWAYSMDSVDAAKDYGIKETQALYLPEKYSRIKLKITDISIHQIQDIFDTDCLKEGIEYNVLFEMYQVKIGKEWKRSKCPRDCFKWLWESIHGKDANKCWGSNPWVFVYSFEVVEVLG